MTSYLHYNQSEMHFCAGDLLIAWQCQSPHEDVEADSEWQASGGPQLRERMGAAVGATTSRGGKGNNPFCTLSNNYSNMKIITVEAMQLYHETNMSYTVIQFMLPVKIITHSYYTEWRWHSCNCVLFFPMRCIGFKPLPAIFHSTRPVLCVWGFSRNDIYAY